MKQTFWIALFTTVFLSCGTGKRTHKNDTVNTDTIQTDLTNQIDDLNDTPIEMDLNGSLQATAIIRDKSIEKCNFLLEIVQENEPKLFEPLDLPAEFQIDGLEVNITYRLSRRPTICALALPIIIDKIERK